MSLLHPKIMSVIQAMELVHKWKKEGLQVVFTNGCFDILHAGHVDLLARSKALGDRLILGLNSDSSVKRQNKGINRPINGQEERAFVLAHLASVDAIVIFDEDTPQKLITALLPNILVKGGDWPMEKIVGCKEVEAAGGHVFSLPLLSDYSTTNIIQKIQCP
jgi:rfaE bifunctional protein nucleotidyltransferase chain/domain